MINFKDNIFSSTLKTVKKYDVVVCGGGPAGCSSALAARRNGAKTLLIERFAALGGNMTFGSMGGIGITGWKAAFKGDPPMVKGIGQEIIGRLIAKNGALPWVPASRRVWVDPWMAIHHLDEMMEESNVEVLFDTVCYDAFVEDNTIKGVSIANKSGGQIVLGDVIIDCTSDADISAAAGVPFEIGRVEDGRRHGGALDMVIGGLNVDRLIEYLKNQPDMNPEERKELDEDRRNLLGGGGTPNVAKSVIDGSPIYREFVYKTTNWEAVDKARKEGGMLRIRMSTDLGGPFAGMAAVTKDGKPLSLPPALDKLWIDYIKAGKVPPLLGAAKLIFPPPRFGCVGTIDEHDVIGVFRNGKWRQDMMYSGVYEMWFDHTNEEEISKALIHMRKINMAYFTFLKERVPGFEDAYIVLEASCAGLRESRRIVGEHMLNTEDVTEGKKFPDVIAKGGHHGPDGHSLTGIWGDGTFTLSKAPFDIPYGCIVPKKIDNLLVPGRSKSATSVGYTGARSMVPMMAVGEAAGTAAALSIRLGVKPRALDVKLLQKMLLKNGALVFFDDEKEREKEVLKYNPPTWSLCQEAGTR
jgi:hypothetical protein